MSRPTSNMQRYYTTLTTEALAILSEYQKPLFKNLFFKNKEGLILNAETVKFSNNNWNHNPMQYCADHYDNQFYYLVVLTCNNLGSIYEFTSDNLSGGIISPVGRDIGRIISYMKEPLDNEYLGAVTYG